MMVKSRVVRDELDRGRVHRGNGVGEKRGGGRLGRLNGHRMGEWHGARVGRSESQVRFQEERET